MHLHVIRQVCRNRMLSLRQLRPNLWSTDMNEQQQKRATVNKTLAIEKLRSRTKRIPVESLQRSGSLSGSPGRSHAITILNGKGWQVLPELGLCLRKKEICVGFMQHLIS